MTRLALLPLALAGLILISGCRSEQAGPPPIGEAFAGPATLIVRKELGMKSAPAATLKHGDRVAVLQTRRRFAKVRTDGGVVGWVDSRQLISTEQMQALRQMAEFAGKMPSQGRATVFEALNVHTEPVRSSPSFAQIPEGGAVEVLAHEITPRNAKPQAPPPIIPPKPAARKPKGKEKKEKKSASSRIPPPPLPPPPPPPPNWLALSQSAPPDPGMDDKKEKEEKPVPNDDWSFVRTKDGKAGWVLTRMLTMSIPDEVAQYAEGHRITSYFPLADVQDEGQTRHYWLWTTLAKTSSPYEFDSFRVFVWSLKRHRYETAYIERNVVGYYPVEATKGTGEHGEGATFSLILEDKDGEPVRKTYVFNGYRVNLINKEPYQRPQGGIPSAVPEAPKPEGTAEAAPAKPGLLDRLKKLFRK